MNDQTAVLPADSQQSPQPVRWFAQIVSIVFHPLFLPTYIAAFLLYKDPYSFASLSEKGKIFKLASVAFSTLFLPFFSVVLMKALGFIQSIFLRTQKDRIIPYIVSMIFYFNIWYVTRNLHDAPYLVAMLLGVFICCIAGMMANIYFKISMHGIAVGALVVLFGWMAFSGAVSGGYWFALTTIIAGLVSTARFIVSDHSPFDVYSGLVVGAVCQLLANAFV
jgi:hypothetical protein